MTSRSNLVPALVVLGALATTAFGLAMAQSRSEVRFSAGSDTAAISGEITGHGYADHVVGARAGQTLSVSLEVSETDGDGTAYFNILPPGSDDVAIFNGSLSSDGSGQVLLPENGDYTIRVYLMGNDEDTGKTVGYTIETSIR